MTKTWERDFAVERMRHDPTISYRALAKVLGLSDQTVRRWRDEEGLPVRPHQNSGRHRSGTRPRPRQANPLQWFGARDEDEKEDVQDWDDESADKQLWDDEVEDAEIDEDDEDEDNAEFDEEDEDEDDAPSTFLVVAGVKILGDVLTSRANGSTSRPPAATSVRVAPSRSGEVDFMSGNARRPTSREEAEKRLRAITAEFEATHPRGPHARELLVEAAFCLKGGASMLGQYGQARGWDPEDITAAERTVAGVHATSSAGDPR